MAVYGKFGKEDIELKNAAEEETLRHLTNIMSKAFNKGSTFDPAAISAVNRESRRTADGLDALNETASDAGDNLEELSTSSTSANKSFRSFSKELKEGWYDIKRGFQSSDPASIIQGTLDGLSSSLDAVAESATVTGNALLAGGAKLGSFALAGLSGITGVVAGEISGLTQNFQNLSNAGLVAGEGVSTFTRSVNESGSTIGQFVNMVQNNSNELSMLGGSVTQGSKQFLGMRKSLKAYEEQFSALGYTFEEMNDVLIDYASSISKGQGTTALTNDQIAQQTTEYAKNLRLISDITGKNAKELKEQSKNIHTEGMVASSVIELGKKLGRSDIPVVFDNMMGQIKEMGPGYEQLAKELMAYGQAVTPATALLQSNNPLQAQAIREQIENLKSGNYEASTVQRKILEDQKKLADDNRVQQEIQNSAYLRSLGDLGKGSDILRTAFEGSGQQYDYFSRLQKTNIDEVLENQKKALKSEDEGTKAMLAVQQAQQKMLLVQNSLSVSMVNAAGTYVADALNWTADTILGIAEDVRIRSTPEMEANRGVSVTDKIVAAAEDLATAVPRAFGGVAEDIASFFGVEKGWAIDKATRGSFTPYYDELRAKEFNEGSNLSTPLPRDYTDYEKEMTERQKRTQQLNDQISRQSDVLLQTMQDNQRTMEELRRSSQSIREEPAPAQAMGNIFDYKPGGYKVTVGELSDEIVAPAKRGADGKLGLEVSGVMLDNSRVLQNLLKVNEGQSALISGLNSQMANMNATFEKLVYEQRQANRLAV